MLNELFKCLQIEWEKFRCSWLRFIIYVRILFQIVDAVGPSRTSLGKYIQTFSSRQPLLLMKNTFIILTLFRKRFSRLFLPILHKSNTHQTFTVKCRDC